MMNRVFAPEEPIDLDPLHQERGVSEQAPAVLQTARVSHGTPGRRSGEPTPLTVLLLAALGGVGLVGALSTVLLMGQWTGFQNSLSQERNLLLIERLRSLGPATIPAPTSATPPPPRLDSIPTTHPPHSDAADLPPPPPEEPWMEQLKELPVARGLPVPAPAPATTRATTPARRPSTASKPVERFTGPLPQLVGLVGAPGQAGSAIFQVGDTSTNVNVGEPIGTSGWTLSAADADSALIERGTEVRRIAIVSGG